MVLAAVGQLCATASITSNLAQCQTLVRKAASAGAKVLFLPEASDYIASSAAESLALSRAKEQEEFVAALQRAAQLEKIHINVGVHQRAAEERLKNCLIWIDDKGVITQNYQKIHLFDVDIKGGPPGSEIVPPFDTPVGRVGLAICFDLRFPEIGLALKRQKADSQPGRPTGSLYFRARAIETQAYVIAAAQGGAHNEKRRSYGHSMIVDPWGEVVAELGEEYDEPQIATAEINLDLVSKIRREMPLLRRTDLYPEV
ncbi:hypothetical protein N7468_010362 [Penicillium chermesinum]|uniref:CN hydrolase domain-containing protein n=1 Tax=Penicillium chermesinum TaxID=63820 RepID=A0A9W9TCG3_9EURO|nr:uncharacterized protein N7468_010362 [Penicillium chermesinum]KAJ5217354.1 hypothetical protein N7468_010362 [Penicillium chermesinum]